MRCRNFLAAILPAMIAPIFPAVASDVLRLDGGGDWDAGRWYVQVDGVMGGKSSGNLEFVGDVMEFSGNIDLDGGGFSSVRRSFSPRLDLSEYAGVVVELEAVESIPDNQSPKGLHLQLNDASSRYGFAAALAVPLSGESGMTTSIFIPLKSFNRGSQMGWQCRQCSLDVTAINGMDIYMLFQSGPFDVTIKSITAVSEEKSFPSPSISFDSADQIKAFMEDTIKNGSSLYNKGYVEMCNAIYWSMLNTLLASPAGVPDTVKGVTCEGLRYSSALEDKEDIAWALRYTIDAVSADMDGEDNAARPSWLPAAEDASVYAEACVGVTSMPSDPSLLLAESTAPTTTTVKSFLPSHPNSMPTGASSGGKRRLGVNFVPVGDIFLSLFLWMYFR